MNVNETELEKRLSALPDGSPDFTRCALHILKCVGLVEEVLNMLEDEPNATVDTITMFESEYRGTLEFYDEHEKRIPVDLNRLALTRGMRCILESMKGKTFKSYEFVFANGAGSVSADCNVRFNLGQYAVDLNCYEFAYDACGATAYMSQLLCEKHSLHDGFRMWSEAPAHAYAIGERITDVELVTDRVKAEVGGETCGFDIDVAVALRTAHAVYTFSRESWRSTDIRISVADGIVIPYEVGECDASWLGTSPEDGIAIAKVTRKTTKLA